MSRCATLKLVVCSCSTASALLASRARFGLSSVLHTASVLRAQPPGKASQIHGSRAKALTRSEPLLRSRTRNSAGQAQRRRPFFKRRCLDPLGRRLSVPPSA